MSSLIGPTVSRYPLDHIQRTATLRLPFTLCLVFLRKTQRASRLLIVCGRGVTAARAGATIIVASHIRAGAPLKTLILAVVAPATILAAPAMAADMFVKAKAPPPPVVIDWSGIYVGGSIGGVWTDAHRFMPNLPQVGIPAQTFTSHGNDTIYDVHVGLQWQWQQWVLGVEGGY